MKHKIYVYGTLMPKDTPQSAKIKAKGLMYDLGWFPGVLLKDSGDDTFLCTPIEADDERLAHLDSYEGYHIDDPSNSLYIRRRFLDGWIYEYNQPVADDKQIVEGDWQNWLFVRSLKGELMA